MLTENRSTETTEPVADRSPETLDPRAARQVDDLEAFINRHVADIGHRWESIADRSFGTLFDGDVAAALAGRRFATPKYDALASRAGTTLTIDRTALSRAIRIGAVNHRLARSDWSPLAWAVKVELLPLLGAGQDFDRLQAGVAVARKAGITVREVRDWVSAQRTEAGEQEPKLPKMTPLKAGKAFEFTAALRKAAQRRELADKVRDLEDDSRKAFLAALADALRNLAKLQQELLNEDEAE
jgi:hypothetical protein